MKKYLLSNERGAILVQAIAVVAAVSAISVLVMNTIDDLANTAEFTGIEIAKSRAAFELTKVIGSSAGCMNTFNGSRLLPDATASIIAGPEMRDENNLPRYRHCLTPVGCSMTNINIAESLMANGDLRLVSSQISNHDNVNDTGIITFSFYDKETPVPDGTTRMRMVRLPLNVFTDGTGTMTSCNFGADNALEQICSVFGGFLEGGIAPAEFCKSLFIHETIDNMDAALKVSGDMQVTRDLYVPGSLLLGSTLGLPSDPGPGRLSGAGQVDVAGNVSIVDRFSIGSQTPSAYNTANEAGKGQFDHSLWMTAGGTARPVIADGDIVINDGGELKAVDRILLDNFVDTTNMSARRTEAVTVAWVKRQIGEALGSGADVTAVWNEIATVAFESDETNSENILRTAFCNSVRVINRRSDGTSSTVAASAADCLARLEVMVNNCNALGNCSTVFANQICLGDTGDYLCYTGKPRWRYLDGTNGTTNECEATAAQGGIPPPGESPDAPFNRNLCDPNKSWMVYNPGNSQCCPIRLVP